MSGSMTSLIGINQNDSKTIKLTEQLNDEEGIVINTFDEVSHNIVPFKLKKFLTVKILKILKGLNQLETKIFIML